MSELDTKTGIYVVTLNCDEFKPIYGKRSTPQDLCVNRYNVKFGKATVSFCQRRKGYQRDFGEHLAGFEPIAVVHPDDVNEAEDIARQTLDEYRIREYIAPDGNTYTQSVFEWCRFISREEIVTKILSALAANGIPHESVSQPSQE